MMSDPAILTEDLTKRYHRVLAVDHLDLCVERQEIFGFLGPNGAGKTTTMRMLLGLVRPTSGSIRMLGMDLATDLPAILARTGSLIETPTFYPFLSGWNNLRVLARITGVPDTRIPAVLDMVDLAADARRAFKTYSLGMKQRLALAAALLTDPPLLLLDEPANGLDPAGIVEMRHLVKRLRDAGRTVFISSHVLHEIEQVCDRIAILVRGQVVQQGPVRDLLQHGAKIEIRIRSAPEAEAALRQVPWVAGITRDGDRLVVAAPIERADELARTLAQRELFASEIRIEEPSLERYFLDVTAGETS
jgi:ABC-2 type transport system ATP-binding protein